MLQKSIGKKSNNSGSSSTLIGKTDSLPFHLREHPKAVNGKLLVKLFYWHWQQNKEIWQQTQRGLIMEIKLPKAAKFSW